MPRRHHGVDRLDHLEYVKENLYQIGRVVNQVRRLGISVNSDEVRTAEANHKNQIVNLINEEVSSILRQESAHPR